MLMRPRSPCQPPVNDPAVECPVQLGEGITRLTSHQGSCVLVSMWGPTSAIGTVLHWGLMRHEGLSGVQMHCRLPDDV